MDISTAISYLRHDDATQDAMKYPVWSGGYAFKSVTGLSTADVEAGKYRLVFVHANGDQFVFKWDGIADFTYEGKLANVSGALAALTGTPVPGSTLEFDADFLEAVAAQTWETGAKSTYEGRRTGAGAW